MCALDAAAVLDVFGFQLKNGQEIKFVFEFMFPFRFAAGKPPTNVCACVFTQGCGKILDNHQKPPEILFCNSSQLSRVGITLLLVCSLLLCGLVCNPIASVRQEINKWIILCTVLCKND